VEAREGRILVADDQADVLKALRLLFKGEGYQVETVGSPAAAVAALGGHEFDLVLIDLNYTRDTTSGREGLDLLSQIQGNDPAVAVVVMTAWGSIELAVEAMRRGARDFVEKPWDNDRLRTIVRTQIELSHARRRGRLLEAEVRLLREGGRPAQFIAESRAMQPVLQVIARVSGSDANVLITGENGTGKGLVAGVLHNNSARSAKPLVTVDVGSLSETVFESEMFGHVKGAYTDARAHRIGRVELADGGSLFLDEIANIPPKFQAKLLRAVETGEFELVGSSRPRHADVRIISATNTDLHAEVAAGRFRQDLLFRLNAVEVRLPPLRERREDIPLLANHFLARHARRYNRPADRFEPEAVRVMMEYPWPGNVRELDHAVQRAVLMTQGDAVRPADLELRRADAGGAGAARTKLEDLTLEEVERVLVEKAMARHGGNVSHAAAALGLSRTALYRRLEKYNLPRGEGQP
jgi:DNA-binding NtrC family response regulator